MQITLISDRQQQLESLARAVSDAGLEVARQYLLDEAPDLKTISGADACLFACAEVDGAVGKQLCSLSTGAVPVILITEDDSDNAIRIAVECGSSLLVTDPRQLSRLDVLLRIARIRHRQNRALLNELTSIKITLENRKLIERAKGIIMKQRSLDEDSAYRAMRKLAMDNNQKMHEVASQILTAAEVLT